ncbi:MAG: YeaH/YhbH family protein, partial [Woeseiaceae bacterium]|nr:YeaH/YhbH family protein [Woeseiaceae bacterium]
MAFLIIDRRQQGKQKSAVNRQRFLKRFRKHIKEAVTDAVNKRSITDMDRGEEISIPKKDISEPIFRHGKGGRQKRVLSGNKEFVRGDRIDRPKGGEGGGGGGQASNQGEGMDEFVFELNQQEFLDFMFEDLELPNMVRKQLKDSDSFKLVKGGYVSEGIPARLNVVQSLRGAKARRIALGGSIKKDIRAMEAELEELGEMASERRRELEYEIERSRRRLNNIPFLDDFDLRYNNMIEQPTPTTSAVMFCLMDVSGSMTQDIKDLAKRFFVLLHMFLKRHYEKTEVVFIRHHTKADEVDEEE